MKRTLAVLVLITGLAALVWAQVAAEVNKPYQSPEGRQNLLKTLTSKDRENNMRPKELAALLGIKPGSTVADVGTGPGMMLPYLLEAVGPKGRIVAEDIQQDFLTRAAERIKSNNWTNVTTVLGTDRDPKLPGGLDLVFVLDAYHHFDYPGEMLGHFARALKADGRLAIADYYKFRKNEKGQDKSGHIRADRDEVRGEIEANGYRLISQHDHGVDQYVLIFGKK
jgi:ubiquinone/menaquinone biosynthesis C-methylase UbiE